MPLEDLTGPDKYLDAFNTDWPLDDDNLPEGDNHIRGVKNVLVNTFGALAAPFEAARAMFWDEPATSQPQYSGAVPAAYGSTAQRPDSPSDFAWRWNTDVETSGSVVEHWTGSAWEKSVPVLKADNFYAGHSDHYCGDQTEVWGNVKGVRWLAADGGAEAARMRSKLTSATQAEIQLQCLLAGVLETVMSLTSGGVDFQNIDGVKVDGVPLMGAQPNYDSGQTAFSAGQTITFTHGLGYRPAQYQIILECVASDADFNVGAQIEFGTVCATIDTSSGNNHAISTAYIDNDTQIKMRISNYGIAVTNGGGAFVFIDMTKWRLRCLAW